MCRGVSPNVQLSCEPWGHADHIGGDCGCLSSDNSGAYVHALSLIPMEGSPVPGLEDFSTTTGESCARMSQLSGMGAGRPGSVPFVSHRPVAYGRLLLAVYVWWWTTHFSLELVACVILWLSVSSTKPFVWCIAAVLVFYVSAVHGYRQHG